MGSESSDVEDVEDDPKHGQERGTSRSLGRKVRVGCSGTGFASARHNSSTLSGQLEGCRFQLNTDTGCLSGYTSYVRKSHFALYSARGYRRQPYITVQFRVQLGTRVPSLCHNPTTLREVQPLESSNHLEKKFPP